MKMEEAILKISDSKVVTKVAKYASAAAEDIIFPLLIPSQFV